MPLSLVWNRAIPGAVFRESSPVAANLGRPAIAVGGLDAKLYAFDAANGGDIAGWPARTSNAINSSPSAADVVGVGTDQVFVGSGIADTGFCSGGGVYSFDAGGHERWHNVGSDPNCSGRLAFHSSPTIGDVNGGGVADLTIGAVGLNAWSFAAGSGRVNPGWPYFTDDTMFATPALADLGGGVPTVIMGGDSSPGGPIDHRGGLVRAVTGGGRTLWQFFTDDIVRSSPAVGDITGSGRPSIVFGTGDFWLHQPGGAQDSYKVFALDGGGHPQWSRDLGGVTMGAPALADVGGTGHADVVIGTAEGPNPGKIWVLDGNGNPRPNWAGHDSGGGVVIGGIATADLNGDGAQDLIVPTGAGIFGYDGRTGAQLFALDLGLVSFQGTPLITDDGNGTVGITVAGATPGGVGIVQHWRTLPGTGARLGPIGWPTFHHDARRTGNLVPPPLVVNLCPPPGSGPGYWFVARDGGVFSYCDAHFHGSAAGLARAPVVAMAPTPSGQGYWAAGADGSVFAFGDAPYHGSMGGTPLNRPIVGMARTPGCGYWLVASDGGMFSFGDATFYGSTGGMQLNRPIVGMARTPSGRGYWLVASDGGIFSYGDAKFFGSTGSMRLNRPIVGMARTPSGRGYWLVASDGGMFSFGDANFLGSTGSIVLNQPIVGMTPTADGRGYWLVASDGGIFAFGVAPFLGSTGSIVLNQPITAMAALGSG